MQDVCATLRASGEHRQGLSAVSLFTSLRQSRVSSMDRRHEPLLVTFCMVYMDVEPQQTRRTTEIQKGLMPCLSDTSYFSGV